jgi:pyrroloquinoline quinone (PQQ) biosynthesis protein C
MEHEPVLTTPGPTRLPAARGDLSDHLFSTLIGPVTDGTLERVEPSDADDEAIALFVLQEIGYRGVDGVDPAWEDDIGFLSMRSALERDLEARVRARTPDRRGSSIADAVQALLDEADGPSLASWMEESAELDHLREFAVHRSAYQLKEADPHTFAVPRLAQGRAKAALLEIQADEYGGNVPSNAHAELFASSMIALGLDPSAGPDLDRLPATTLATSTFLNLLGRSRRLAGACVAHLCVFEMTSVEPMAHYAQAVRRLVPDDMATEAARFFDVHVAADGYHAQLAVHDLLDGLDEDHPDLAADAFFGAAGLMVLEADFTEQLLGAWKQGRTSLRQPLEGSSLAADQRRSFSPRDANDHARTAVS